MRVKQKIFVKGDTMPDSQGTSFKFEPLVNSIYSLFDPYFHHPEIYCPTLSSTSEPLGSIRSVYLTHCLPRCPWD